MTAHATIRRAQLFDQLTALFLAEGFAHLTLDSIASRLRCSKSTLYTLADSKDELVRAATVHFFIDATAAVETAVSTAVGTTDRIATYLDAVGTALAPASATFMDDLAGFAPAREVYERNTAIAADRIRQFLTDGVRDGEVRDVHVSFVADIASATMVRIQNRDVLRRTGLNDSAAYRELADLVTAGISTRIA